MFFPSFSLIFYYNTRETELKGINDPARGFENFTSHDSENECECMRRDVSSTNNSNGAPFIRQRVQPR